MQFDRTLLVSFLLGTFILRSETTIAQETLAISVQGTETMSIHAGEGIGIHSDIVNSGVITSFPGATVNFLGHRWSNRAGSRLADESADGRSGIGGSFRFRSSGGSLQFVENQSNITGFPSIIVANQGNLMVEGADLYVRRNLNFEAGHLLLNNRNVVLPAGATITGFDHTRFIVTGGGVNGGFLIRNTAAAAQGGLHYPVGTAPGSYTPLSLSFQGAAQDLKVRVFNNVYDRAVFGIPDNVNYVPKTWHLALSQSDANARVIVRTQHDSMDEGPNFSSKRAESYISRYDQATDTWDIHPVKGATAGTITTGTTLATAWMHTRDGLTTLRPNEYFSKSSIGLTTATTIRIPEGISPNNDGLNDHFIIQNLKPADQVRLEIYNRWQTLVFRDLNYKNTFEGIGNQKGLVNNVLADGTYYYILNINGEKPVTGFIVINR